MGRSLTPGTAARIQSAVDSGLNDLGICAGALLGIHPEAPTEWYRAIGSDASPAGAKAAAVTVIESALHRRPLASYVP